MIPELGHFALILALVLAVVQATVPLVGAARNRYALMAVARPAAQGQLVFLLIAYACLTWAFINSDFSLRLAATNSHSDTPLIYKITGVWGNHEGSLLLWALSLSLWTVAVSVFSRSLPEGELRDPDRGRHAHHLEPPGDPLHRGPATGRGRPRCSARRPGWSTRLSRTERNPSPGRRPAEAGRRSVQ